MSLPANHSVVRSFDGRIPRSLKGAVSTFLCKWYPQIYTLFGNQTWCAGKLPIYRWFSHEPPFYRDCPLPCLITGGYVSNKWMFEPQVLLQATIHCILIIFTAAIHTLIILGLYRMVSHTIPMFCLSKEFPQVINMTHHDWAPVMKTWQYIEQILHL